MTRSTKPLPWETIPDPRPSWTEVRVQDGYRQFIVHVAKSRGLAEMRADGVRAYLRKAFPKGRSPRVVLQAATANKNAEYSARDADPRGLDAYRLGDRQIGLVLAGASLPDPGPIPEVANPSPRPIPASTGKPRGPITPRVLWQYLDEIDVFTANEILMNGGWPIPADPRFSVKK